MAKAADNQATVYKIEIPPIKNWNKERGEWDAPTIYSTPAWVKYHEKLSILDGVAQTADILIAMELVDMGATVTPDPRPVLQEQRAQELLAEMEISPTGAYELSRFVNETNAWRAEHGYPKLSVEAPKVSRPLSALVTANQMPNAN